MLPLLNIKADKARKEFTARSLLFVETADGNAK
jgi:hypothetical protein